MPPPTQDPTAPGPEVTGTSSSPSSPPSSPPPGEEVTDEQSPAEAFRDVGTRLGELAEYFSYYLAAKADSIKVSLRNAGIYAALGVIGLLAGGAFVVTAVVLLCRGVAEALAELFGKRAWAGDLVAAVIFLAILGAGVWLGMSRLTKASRERTVKKYDQRQQQQRAKFGTDVKQRAENPGK